MKRLSSRLISFVPLLGSCFTVAWWDRVTPRIFGLPFNFAWLMAWMVLTALCLAAAYRLRGRDEDSDVL